MRRIIKGLLWVVFSLIPLALLAAVIIYVWIARSVAPESGEAQLAGLGAPVTVTRDRNAVPHISGASMEDVAMALGFVHAQERLWQMEVARMAAQGRLSEIFGEATVATDMFLRTIDAYGAAADSFKVLNARDRGVIEAYARGVNAFIDRNDRPFASKFSPEFVLLDRKPEPWQATDVVAAVKMMSVTLAANIGEEMERLKFARLGMSNAEMNDLLPPLSEDTPPHLPDLKTLLGLASGPVNAALPNEQQFAALDGIMGQGASNNWVLAGTKTETGKPMLANDPHLEFTAPSLWYLAHLQVKAPGGETRNLIGVTLPGTPLVFLGRNDRVAWGFTNTAADVQDIFVERINPDNPDEYLTPEGYRPFDKRTETIRVKDEQDVTFERRATRHGPVLPANYRGLQRYLPQGTVPALQWTALAQDDTTISAGFRLWDFQSVEAYLDGMHDFVTPMQSMVVADVDGNIGLIAPGRVPVRDPANQIMGRAPSPGWDAIYDWKGYIPYEDLPRQYNPTRGAIGTANSKIVDSSYAPFLTFDWDEAWRRDRIATLMLDSNVKQTLETNRQAQGDDYSPAYAALGPVMLGLVEGRSDVNADDILALKRWDYREDKSRSEPLIFEAWLRFATKRIISDDLGDAFPGFWRARATAMLRWLSPDAARDWCDDGRTPERESCGDVLALALKDAESDLETRLGSDRSAWNWGALHYAYGAHRPFARVKPLDRIFDVNEPASGGAYTLDRGTPNWNDEANPYRATHGTSYRGIFDLGDLDRSTYIQTTGQSGNVLSTHYRDMAERWGNIEAFTIPASEAGYQDGMLGTWKLLPKR
ncbi:penicillin acylase family protein [Phyllobacterium salinisoli]|uniref:Penicillin acylase family protein n=1 Tax=Phyllobacterium salinisoli TaxID=1899321 RepID=A0A368K7V5_9HYPH|nr:penicillin acylase family protein [Phyllobacterium salinisoli]RCS25311.1 penicillin acylase family protein [Phyllobacterium salinisoli]